MVFLEKYGADLILGMNWVDIFKTGKYVGPLVSCR